MLQSRASELQSTAGAANGQISWSAAIKNLGQLLFFNVPAVLAAAKGNP
jgi:formate/nitrite transporter FocA (FNT family)